jgi:transcriptional regulator with XRE-family HTH domain
MEVPKEKNALHILFGNNLKKFRERAKLSQIALSIKAGVANNFIHDIEHGDRGVSFGTILKLSKALHVSSYRFFLPETEDPMHIEGNYPDHIELFLKAVEDLKSHYENNEQPDN